MLEVVERKQLRQGVLIAIEGIDGAGKTTQARILAETLTKMGYLTIELHEPTNGEWGKKIKDLAKNGRHKTTPETELELFYLDRVEDVKNHIRPSLEEKKIVIMDRYYFSNVAYQSERGLDPDYIEKRNEIVAPIPAVTIILDLDPEVSLKRIRRKRNAMPNHFEKKEYLERVRQAFLKQFSGRPGIRIIDGDDSRSIQVIASEIWKIVEPIIREAEEK